MRIVVAEFHEEKGVSVSFDLGASWAAGAAGRALDVPPSALVGAVEARRAGSRVSVVGSFQVAAAVPCARCTHATDLSLGGPFALAYEPDRAAETGSEHELDEADLDLGFYTDGVLDLADVLSEAIALEAPMRVTCLDEPACEARTEALLAAARPDVGHPAFQALRTVSR